ncbi:MAG TPA: hypothetical protein VNK48_13195 [Xanthobacteraceae bacterium]|nr:hypothetical protein [Xanthobacteraceae bacterium]
MDEKEKEIYEAYREFAAAVDAPEPRNEIDRLDAEFRLRALRRRYMTLASPEARKQPRPLTRADIDAIVPGAMIRYTLDSRHAAPLPNARWSPRHRVSRVFARDVDCHGKAFVCFYVEIGERTRMSMSAKEGESYVQRMSDN